MVSTHPAGSTDIAPAKFSLSLGSKVNRAKHQVREKQATAPQQYVATFDPDQTPAAASQRIIPKQADTFQGPGSSKPQRFLPTPGEALVDTSERFETAAPEEADTSITYGLTLHTKAATAGAADTATVTTVTDAPTEPAPPLVSAEQDLARYQQQLDAAAEEATLDEYTNTPIEEFGAALLRGMGWAEGKAVGRRNIRGVVPQAIEFVPRPSGLGLGANPAPAAPKREKKYIKPGESRQQKPDLVALDANGNIKNVRGLDDKLVERSSLGAKPGKTMRIIDGRHSGLSCIVLALEPHIEGRSDKATVRLLPSETTATVRLKELAEKGTAAPAAAVNGNDRYSNAKKADTGKKRSHGQSDSDLSEIRHISGTTKRQRKSDHSDEEDVPPAAASSSDKPWLAPHIMVKIVDKHLQGGKLYLKKAEVIEVTQPTRCTLYSRDLRKYVSDVHQNLLETVVPQEEGSRLLVVSGKHRGQRVRLLRRSRDAQVAVVQFMSDLSQVAKLSFDDVSSYVGDKGEEE